MPRPRLTPAERQSVPQQTPASGELPALPLIAFGAIALGFLWLYYFRAPVEVKQVRWSTLAFIVAPDHLLGVWCGGKLANFSLLDRWPIALLAAVILSGAWLAGRLLLAALGLDGMLDRLERFVFAVGAGLNLISLYALAVGLAGLLQQRWVFVAPLIALGAGNVWIAFRRRGGTPQRAFPTAPAGAVDSYGANDRRWYWLLLAAAPFAVAMVLGGMLPPWSYDVREYHLQAPKEWFQNGRVAFLPHNIYANMPLGAELNSVWAMSLAGGDDGWWWGAIAGKTVMACYPLVTAAALLAFGRRVHSLAAGCVAAAVFLATPWTVALAGTGYNESGVMLYAILSIDALWLSRRPEHAAHVWRFDLLAGFLAGSAVACKYPPALFVVIPLLLWIAASGVLLRRGWRQAALSAALFVVAVFAGCGLWLAKNGALAGNPVYPLLYSQFDGRTRTPEKDRQWTRVHSPQPDERGRRFTLRSAGEQLVWVGWKMRDASSILLPLAAMAVFASGQRRLIGAIVAWMVFVFLAWWLVTHRLDRFLLLLLPAGALLAGIGAAAIDHPTWRAATLAFVAVGLVVQFPLATLPMDNRFLAPLAPLRRDDLSLPHGGDRLNPTQRWLNEHAQPGERVLLVGDAEPFELQIGAVYNTCFDDCQFERLFKGHTRDERLAALRAEKIRYVLCNWSHLARYRSPGNYGYTSDYITPELVHRELVAGQRLLRPIETTAHPQLTELFEVVDE